MVQEPRSQGCVPETKTMIEASSHTTGLEDRVMSSLSGAGTTEEMEGEGKGEEPGLGLG